MNKEYSLDILQSCIDRIINAPEEDVEMFREKYNMHCREPLTSSKFQFIPPADLESLQAECTKANKKMFP